jgi:hypothetical protein
MSNALASHCSLHSCVSSEYGQPVENSAASYSTSVSSDTLFWDPNNEGANRQNKQHPRQQQNPTYHTQYIQRYVHPGHQVQPIQTTVQTTHAYTQPQQYKPKSWDNLKASSQGGYGFGYTYLDTSKQCTSTSGGTKTSSHQVQPPQQAQRVVLPRKTGQTAFARYTTFADVDNYAPPPTQFLEEETTTTTTIITKSTENLIGAQYNHSDGSCECLSTPPAILPPQPVAINCVACNNNNNAAHPNYHQQGYYSNLSKSSSNRCVPTKTEITRL